ncbi:hypothetical protein BH23THE1_BH23THE1_32340 [soil metagenome]
MKVLLSSFIALAAERRSVNNEYKALIPSTMARNIQINLHQDDFDSLHKNYAKVRAVSWNKNQGYRNGKWDNH